MMLHDIRKRKKVERKTVRERKLEELEKPVKIQLSTKVPEKWVFIDLETGEVWRHTGKNFKEVNSRNIISETLTVLRDRLKELMNSTC